MEKKFTFSDQPLSTKIMYAAVILILCISAVVVGLVAANNRKNVTEEPQNIIENKNQDTVEKKDDTQKEETPDTSSEAKEPTFVSPAVGVLVTEHSLTVPVFSDTLNEWRIHTGVDISTEENASVYAAADGMVSAIYKDPKYGMTVEISHGKDFKTVYSNLSQTIPEGIQVGAPVVTGDIIGTVGDTALYELALEPHLHFGMKVKEVFVNPMDYISKESKKASLGIDDTSDAQ